ncbi:serine/threonine-protein kinase [Polyangium aurulentum]|uniref:serine/threonine-protein kinase n=1 Tax=Polyangium aurulentum TaxID=2567896 RepID=UPI00146C8B89|nr:serine/threonine-protein kinase [Polyangium aurulentum]UQA61381.1 protein kinase [Polyangium aurulentum]
MSGKRLLEELGRLAREEDIMADPRWDALAAGTATPEDEAALLALASRYPKARAAYEALRPMDEAAMDRLVERVVRELEPRDSEAPSRNNAEGLLARAGRVLDAWTGRRFFRSRTPSRVEAAVPRRLPRGTLAGKYKLTSQIGAGAMGSVWEGVNTRTGRKVAIKLILQRTDELRQRLLREARACGSLSHRNIVELYDVGETADGEPFLVMQLLQGQTLADLLKVQRRIEPTLAARIGRDIASALSAAHAAKIIHRDLKPANIFLHREEGMAEGDFVVKVLDFGLAKNLEGIAGPAPVTNVAVGSPAYMSPEQVSVSKDLDHKTDLWSLGIVLYEMLTGGRPFVGTVSEVIRQILASPIPRVSSRVRGVPPEFDELVARCLERDPRKRPTSAADLAGMLGACAKDGAAAQEFAILRREPAPETRSATGIEAGATSTGAMQHSTTVSEHRTRSDETSTSKPRLRSGTIQAAFGVVLGALAILALVVTLGLFQGRGAQPATTSAWQTPAMLAAMTVVSILLVYTYTGWRRAARQLSATTQRIDSMALEHRNLLSKIAAVQKEDQKKIGWLAAAHEENTWLRTELERRPKLHRKKYRILTLGMKATGKTSLTLKWSNPLVDLGAVEGTKIERYERSVCHKLEKDRLIEHVFEVHDWGGEHIVDAQQALVLEDIHGLLLVVDLGGKDARQVDPARVAEQIQEFQPQALRHFFPPKLMASCKTVVLFINKSDLIAGTPAEVDQQAMQLYRPLIEALMKYASRIDVRVLVGSARYGHSTHLLFAHFVEQILPKTAYDDQLLQRLKVDSSESDELLSSHSHEREDIRRSQGEPTQGSG